MNPREALRSSGTRPGVYPSFSGTLAATWTPAAMLDALLRTDVVKRDPERARQLRIARSAYRSERRR